MGGHCRGSCCTAYPVRMFLLLFPLFFPSGGRDITPFDLENRDIYITDDGRMQEKESGKKNGSEELIIFSI